MSDAAAAGARAAIVLTSGFGETGGDGRAAQQRLGAIGFTEQACDFSVPTAWG